ncbi:hypothetical protein N7539_006627 [Penicillium diatomitis]|uniref:Cytidyltransferase-like domain-containing protein n=1 Tax=Penicillium diatomitis TaxID=2819901 RepID=A0A9W9X1N8_9EURO|nr:uncharacterized protein N7539_006627 [Penicillium diatomitis]KAJ5480733.1 hypothetical protein N7539_006627 [Penicillium diatomitis]
MAPGTSAPAALLLLPPPPSFSLHPLKKVFEEPLAEAICKIVKSLNDPQQTATLDVVLQVPGLLSASSRPRASVFAPLQHYLSSIYTLIGAAAAARQVELDAPGGLDARVLFTSGPDSCSSPSGLGFGPIVDLKSLVTSARQWNQVFYLGVESGRQLYQDFLRVNDHNRSCTNLQDHELSNMNSQWSVPSTLLQASPPGATDLRPHYSVCVGGTFDHLHLGHKLLLTALALTVESPTDADQHQERLLTIGVTGDALLKNKKYAEFLESWRARFESTAAFLRTIMDFTPHNKPRVEETHLPGPNGHSIIMHVLPHLTFKFVEIWDPFGPTITVESLTALVVSKETASGGVAVNEERSKKGWKNLTIFEVDVLQTGEVADVTDVNNFESKISSTDIRRRRMNLAKV